MTVLTDIRQAVLDPAAAVPDGLVGPDKAPAGKRFDVYRNNVTHSLIAALGTAFPLVRKILGTSSFDRLAPVYVRLHPPTSPLMMHYGYEFPAFLAAAPQLAKLGYLPDCARLDLALRQSYHAADAEPLDLVAFQQLPPEAMMQSCLKPAPATRVLTSRWPLFDIWRFNMINGAPKPELRAQDIMITRPQFDPEPHLLPAGAAHWLSLLSQGNTLEQASDATSAINADFDLAASLALTFANGSFRAIPEC